MERFCENCGHEMSDSNKFCEKCGNQIIKNESNTNTKNKYCKKCGALIKENSRFCNVCGFVVDDVPQKSYNLFLILGYLSGFGVLFIDAAIFGIIGSVTIGLYLITRPETQQNKILYLHGLILVIMPLLFFVIRICFL